MSECLFDSRELHSLTSRVADWDLAVILRISIRLNISQCGLDVRGSCRSIPCQVKRINAPDRCILVEVLTSRQNLIADKKPSSVAKFLELVQDGFEPR